MKAKRTARTHPSSTLLSLLLAPACILTGEGKARAGDAPQGNLPTSKSQVVAVPTPKPTETVDLSGGVKMEFVLIPPGSFTMGSEESGGLAHKVTLTKPFYLGKFEVTQEQWQTVMGTIPSTSKGPKVPAGAFNGPFLEGTHIFATFNGPRLPVGTVTWDDCQSFLAKLQEKTEKKFALPTEAQWEYACRAGATTRYSFGDSDANLAEYAWFTANSAGTPHPVGGKKPNAWGLYDMHGNVAEWCADWYSGPFSGEDVTDPQGSPTGNQRVFRGCAWFDEAHILRSSARGISKPDLRSNYIGLRCVMLIGEASR